MAKKLSARVAELMKRERPSHKGAKRAEFLAVQKDIRQALGEDWSLHGIWYTLRHEGKITFSYQTFCRLARRHLSRLPVKAEKEPVLAVKGKGQDKRRGTPGRTGHHREVSNKETTAGMRGFIYNPIPNEEELI